VFWSVVLIVQALLGDGAWALSGRSKQVKA
jgi:hypothetical protein